jgi:phosphatidate cytidylyltransferase
MTLGSAEPETPRRPAGKAGNLARRTLSGIAMAALALGTAWWGGALFAVFWIVVAAIVFWEWFGLLTLGADHRAVWMAAGMIYAAILAIAPILLRSDTDYGLPAILFLFAVVWTTDIAAYFVGRSLGGPKLWPAISPNKTWSGALGGTIAAIGAAVVFASQAMIPSGPAAVLAAVLSILAQGGDLFESHLKRHFGVKDSSHIIPGHGGVMDRIDGFIVAACVAGILGLVRGGLDHPARGMLLW